MQMCVHANVCTRLGSSISVCLCMYSYVFFNVQAGEFMTKACQCGQGRHHAAASSQIVCVAAYFIAPEGNNDVYTNLVSPRLSPRLSRLPLPPHES